MNIQKIFITGGTGDLGSALVKELLKHEHIHIVTNGRDQKKADEFIHSLPESEQKRIAFFVGDMSKQSSDEIASSAYDILGGIDMLISNVALFQFDDILEKDNEQMERLYATNLGGKALAESVVNLAVTHGHHVCLCDIGSTSVIADMLGNPFPDTMHYGKTKSLVVRHSIEMAHNNPLVSFRAIHPGSINGKIAKEIAVRYGSTFVTTPEITALHAIEFFLEQSTDSIRQLIITSENYFAWSPQGAWYNKEDEITHSPLVEGMTSNGILKIPVDGINSFEVTA